MNKYSITECVEKLTELTNTNLSILKGINDSFAARTSHVGVAVGDTNYYIPSFLYVENKIDSLQANFENLVNAPMTGEAAFSFDGNTQSIMLQGFQNAPAAIDLNDNLNNKHVRFNSEVKDVLKDFTTPNIYTTLDLSILPEHINDVNVRKVVLNEEELISLFDFNRPSHETIPTISYTDMLAKLYNYSEDEGDYVMYDTKYTFPVSTPTRRGEWSVKEIITDSIDPDTLIETITLRTNEDVIYEQIDTLDTKYLQIGDILVTYDDKCKLEVVDVDIRNRKLTLRVLVGYTNIYASDTPVLKYFNQSTHRDRTIKVSLEEDQYVIIFASPINTQINVQGAWGEGLMMDVYDIKHKDTGEMFNSFYKNNVTNIGDIIYDIAQFTSGTINNILSESFYSMTKYKPILNVDDFPVIQVNKHLFDTAKLDSIRKLNAQKSDINNRLMSIQDEIINTENILSTTDFSNMTPDARRVYENKLIELNSEKGVLNNTLYKTSQQMTLMANSTHIPTNVAKYAVIGYVNVDNLEGILNALVKDDPACNVDIIKLNVSYRYKNGTQVTGAATTIGNQFVFSDWNTLITPYRDKETVWNENMQRYEFKYTSTNDHMRQFNSIMIPITDGETVDIRIQLQYSAGYPYLNTLSDWSDNITITFPDDIVVGEDIRDILDKNVQDSNILNLKDLLNNEGVSGHVNDEVLDQDKTFLHRSESVASGFYTQDTLRNISLKDKLYDMDAIIKNLKSVIDANISQQFDVIVTDGISSITLSKFATAQDFYIPNYILLGGANENLGTIRSHDINISIVNTGDVPMNLYSMYYGDTEVAANQITTKTSKWFEYIDDYYFDNEKVSFPIYITDTSDEYCNRNESQTLGQVVNFKGKIPFTSKSISYDTIENKYKGERSENYNDIAPIAPDLQFLQSNGANPGSFKTINPGEQLLIPLRVRVEYKLASGKSADVLPVSFSIWNSPYDKPIDYTFNVHTPYSDNIIRTTKKSGSLYSNYTPNTQKSV